MEKVQNHSILIDLNIGGTKKNKVGGIRWWRYPTLKVVWGRKRHISH